MKALIFALTLVSCTSSSYYEHPPMEWVDQDIFQQNLEVCRRQVYCNAGSLFDG